ncbi:Coenzyme F420 hydrogenase/dehydrogenase, beta subunit C-terminal domain [Bacteroides sp. 51]|uniref:Coenzyme F420 hydrogenase/dehydrogenase, beta subunit C-terminal domain n=1 Tax=Bacteroides sp. 51 TaxID=2302938 RepID=UPI0013D220AA|nr:Coenzyme F420 hydrogenase/dehydrogenase, beta subunit C-terminal domain [Bacteroides sp. 51]NDV82029.1 4Fe-4S dicluster domain-containing protein [Bacteroides sp. 51]
MSQKKLIIDNNCCGCYACLDICPQKCITMKEDEEGFNYPSINNTKCIECGKCVSTCPNTNIELSSRLPYSTYAAIANNDSIHKSGSSGGVFSLLADYIIKNGGKVWGAAFDSNLQLKHTSAVEKEDISKLCRSKYIQSSLQGVYKAIKLDLSNNVFTLFVGTPCQCSALRNFLKKEYSNLLIVDFVCHGVPSQSLFNSSLKWFEKKKNCTVTDFVFRHKSDKGKHLHAYKIEYTKKGKKRKTEGLHYDFPYYFGFQKYVTLRPSCYTCKYTSGKRCGDLTLGDFWGIEKHWEGINAHKGVSMILSNTDKGENIINKLAPKLQMKEIPFDIAQRYNTCLNSPAPKKAERDLFFKALKTETFDRVVDLYLRPKRKWVFKVYYMLPTMLRRIVRKRMEGKMKYE